MNFERKIAKCDFSIPSFLDSGRLSFKTCSILVSAGKKSHGLEPPKDFSSGPRLNGFFSRGDFDASYTFAWRGLIYFLGFLSFSSSSGGGIFRRGKSCRDQ